MAKIIPWSEFLLMNMPKNSPVQREPPREQIRENPYLQYFLGLSGYSNARPFDSSMFVYFRQRIGVNPRK
ncbi:MAG: transposase [Microcoleus sp. PH2017_39_LGB_O_B]|nr:transposase [Microcoleus sp. PH2017_39_LGB_O_B]